MKQEAYVVFFATEKDAFAHMLEKNKASRKARSRDVFCLTDGPEDNFAVVDLLTAIELGGTYTWQF